MKERISKKFIYCGTFILAIALFSSCQRSKESSNDNAGDVGPVVKLTVTSGTLTAKPIIVYVADVVHYEILWQNDDDSTKVLSDVSVSCGCTRPELSLPLTVSPHGSAIIPVTLDTYGKRGTFSEIINGYDSKDSLLWEITLSGKLIPKVIIDKPVTTQIIRDLNTPITIKINVTSQVDYEMPLKVTVNNRWTQAISGDTSFRLAPKENRLVVLQVKADQLQLPEYIKCSIVNRESPIAFFTVQLLGDE